MKKILKENIIFIILGLLLVSVIFYLVYINYMRRDFNKETIKSQLRLTPAPLATATPLPIPTELLSLPSINPAENKSVQWNIPDSRSLFQKVLNRKPLTGKDAEISYKLLFELLPEDGNSGTLYETPNIKIDYVYANTDVWEVEILTTDIASAKAEAVKWFLDNGLSQDFICNYPVEFYLNAQISQELSGTGIVFSPLAPGCK